MDANANGGTVAGWGTTPPSSTTGNAAWQFFPIELSEDDPSPDLLPTATIISQGETNTSAPWGSWTPSSGWANKFTTNANSGIAGVEISATTNAFNRETDYGQRVFVIKPSATGATDVITITAPTGYIIKSYSIGGHYLMADEKYTLTSADGSQTAEVNTNSGSPNMLTVDNIYAQSTTFSLKSKGSTNNKFACITQFTVTLCDNIPVSVHAVNEGECLTPTPSSKDEGSIYELTGQRLSKPMKGVNIINGKIIINK